MLLFKLNKNQLEYGLAKLANMCNKATTFGELRKIEPYQRILFKQCLFSQELDLAASVSRQVINAASKLLNMEFNRLQKRTAR